MGRERIADCSNYYYNDVILWADMGRIKKRLEKLDHAYTYEILASKILWWPMRFFHSNESFLLVTFPPPEKRGAKRTILI